MIGARVRVMPKRAVLDAQGEAVRDGLHRLGHDIVSDVRVGRLVELELDTDDEREAHAALTAMSAELLVNDVVEYGEIELTTPAGAV